ncbi:Uncharacterised protein [Legionella steigerwaltii]|uniref:Uncharacterized protein n=1 Tax=Legionella steigerwaltii TaxID=460 RepID=A0A378L9V6_9GAMM|nr:hypothetical protein [Legionella steigerwaltii]KTD71667.1 hypothetical protein Lstg_2875 [Legionella steigerwaltii]STY23835.1 Uncharacterised protein [Legionella steigerwaltii]
MPSIYLTYAITSSKELVVASYHSKLQSKANALPLIRGKEPGFKLTDLKYLEGEAIESAVKAKLLELLASIPGEYDKVTYKGDLNLCTSDKKPAPYLFDGTLNRFYAGKDVDLILESANEEYVRDGIAMADEMHLKGAVVQIKTGSGTLSQVYPKPVIQDSKMDLSVPKPKPSELAQPSVPVRDPHVLAEALGKFGSFSPASESTPTPSQDKDKVKTDTDTPGLTG